MDPLTDWLPRIEAAAQDLGLDPGEVEFRVVPAPVLYEAVAYDGLGGYGHWTRGRNYWLTQNQLDHGGGRIYEVVYAGQPAVAYLLDSNPLAAQLLVMAHVLGHADLLRHHVLGADETWAPAQAAARRRFAHYAEEWGAAILEATLDAALSVRDQAAEDPPLAVPAPPAPPTAAEFLAGDRPRTQKTPPPRYRVPTTDLIGFLARESPILADWQRDVLSVVRREGLRAARMVPIKTVHESYAAWVHRAILRTLTLPDQEAVTAMRVHARVVAPDPLGWNPYSLYPLLDHLVATEGFPAARAIWLQETDASLVRTWLTPDRWAACQLYGYTWERDPDDHRYDRAVRRPWADADDWAAWRDALADQLAALRPPVIQVTGVDRHQTLLLAPEPGTPPLDRPWARRTLHAVWRLWGSSVVLTLPDGSREEVSA